MEIINFKPVLRLFFLTWISRFVDHKVLLEGTVSQIFDLGLSFYFMLKNG